MYMDTHKRILEHNALDK